jgi:hypothetical protein
MHAADQQVTVMPTSRQPLMVMLGRQSIWPMSFLLKSSMLGHISGFVKINAGAQQ